MSETSNSKRMAKNTLFMYFRMGITMLVTLFTSRIVLQVLGVDDYGIYNIVGSVVVAFSFLSGPLGAATQRFYNFELGKNDTDRLNSVFNHSVIIYSILCAILFVVIEIGGLWFIANKMQLPPERMYAAQWAFQFSILCFIIGLIRMPFESLIIAHERMSFYAYVSIVEVVLKLINVYVLMFVTMDKLILYAFNQVIIALIIIGCIYIFCKKSFQYIYFKRMWDKDMFRSLMSFSGWSLFGSLASMTANQGLNILLNVFYGVVVNAAMGIANQVSNAVNQFVINFQIAFRPQLIKSYANNEIAELRTLISRTSKFSFLLLFAIACPLIFNLQFLLEIWLGKDSVPEYSDAFTTCILIYALLETLSAPMCTVIQATGRIKTYQLVISAIMFCNILLSYVFLKLGYPPVVVLEIKCCLDCVYLFTRMFFMRNMVGFSIREYSLKVLLPLIIVVSISSLVTYLASHIIDNGWITLFVSTSIFLTIYTPLCLYVGMASNERNKIIKFALNKIKK